MAARVQGASAAADPYRKTESELSRESGSSYDHRDSSALASTFDTFVAVLVE